VNRYGNNILYRGYDSGQRIKKKIKFQPTLYVKGKGGSKFTSLDGINVEPMKFDSMRDAKDLHADITKLLITLEQMRVQQARGPEVVEVQITGGSFKSA
jgi:hypothetical protein